MMDTRYVAGGAEAVRELTDWLHRILTSCETEEAMHVDLYAGQGPAIWGADLGLGEEAEPFAREVVDVAEKQCLTEGVESFRIDIRNRRLSKRFQLRSPEPAMQVVPMPLPPGPDLGPIVAQQMMHNERLFQMAMGALQGKDEILMRAFRELQREVSEHRARERQRLMDEMKLRDMAFARRHMEREFERQQERKDLFFDELVSAAKYVAFNIGIAPPFGGSKPPAPRKAPGPQSNAKSATAGDNQPLQARCIALLKLVRPEQWQRMGFDDEQQQLFIEIYQELLRWDEEHSDRPSQAKKVDMPSKQTESAPKK